MSEPRLRLAEIRQAFEKKKFSSVELTQKCFKAIHAAKKLGPVFLGLREEKALTEAQSADARRTKGQLLSPIDGIPIAIKDNIVMQDEISSCASKLLENYVSPYDSHVAGALKRAGAIVLGRTNMDEFAMGSSNENSAFGVPRNPWNPQCVGGGSSGGSAIAVAANLAPLSLGSDTGGSVRLPASFCGIVGLKPTYGRVSRYGLVAFASSLDQIGPFAAHVEDVATLFNVIAGHNPNDSTSVADPPLPLPIEKEWQVPLRGIRLGIPKECMGEGVNPDVHKAFDAAVAELKKLGAKISTVSLPHSRYCIACYYVIACAEASANLARFDGIRYGVRDQTAQSLKAVYINSRNAGLGAEVKRRIMLGTFVLASGYYEAYYHKALQVRELIKQDFANAFKECDCLITPTAPFTAFPLGAKANSPLEMYLSDIYTTSINIAGLPAISVPCGFNSEQLPIGLQTIGKAFAEKDILRVAYQYEQATTWHKQVPQ